MNDWSWQEVSNEEFERRRKRDTYYKIFSVSGRRPNVVKKTHYKFWAKGRVAALRVLRRFAKENADGPYYYSTSGYHWCGRKRYDDMREMMADRREKRNADEIMKRRTAFRKERRRVFGGLTAYLKTIKTHESDLKFAIKDILYFLRNYDLLSNRSHQICERWSIDNHILETLSFNLPLLIKKKVGIPNEYCEKARRQLKESRKRNGALSKTAMDLADSLWTKELEKLLLYVRLYNYYEGYGIINKRNRDEVAIHEKYGKTLPYLKGTYFELDYRKLRKLCDKYWNLWITQYRKIGRSLWD